MAIHAAWLPGIAESSDGLDLARRIARLAWHDCANARTERDLATKQAMFENCRHAAEASMNAGQD
jgi:hypothetical protein